MRTLHIVLPIITVAALFLSCGKGTVDPMGFKVPEVAPDLTESQLEMSDDISTCGLDLFYDLFKDKEDDVLYSPLSLSVALSLCGSGAMGETQSQLAAAQGLEGYSNSQIASYYQTVIGRLLSVDPSVKFGSANAVWVDGTMSVKNGYKSMLATYYGAEAFNVDFGAPKAVRDQINHWASTHTEGKIPQVLDEDPEPPMLLANALSFYAGWGVAFDHELKKEAFYGSKGNTEEQYFTRTGLFGYLQTPVNTLLSIPYGNGLFEFLLILPNSNSNVQTSMMWLRSNQGAEAMKQLRNKKEGVPGGNIFVQIPRFEICCSTAGIVDALIAKGFRAPFSDKADFSGISESPLFIEKIIQKSYISVNEKGTDAAAVSVITMATSTGEDSGIPMFVANRPFIFLIREKGSDTILFAGLKQ